MKQQNASSKNSSNNERNYKSRMILVVMVLAMVIVAGIIAWQLFSPKKHELVFSSGSEAGLYNQLALAIEKVVEKFHPNIDIAVRRSDGSNQNLERIDQKNTDLGLIQNDAKGGQAARSIAAIYPEILHLVARRDAKIKSLNDLNGRNVNIGADGSGTQQVAKALLDFASVSPQKENLLSFTKAAEALKAGTIDAGFFLTGIPGQFMEELLSSPDVHLIPLIPKTDAATDTELASKRFINGFQTNYPFVSVQTIPMMSYKGLPELPVPTLGVSAVLVASKDLPNSTVQSIAKTLFDHRVDLTNEVSVFAKLEETSASKNLRFPLHEGADSFYRRSEPGFLTKHAESMGFILTIILLGWSCLAAGKNLIIRERKDHADTYYAAVDEIMAAIKDDLTPAEANQLKTKLLVVDHEIRQDLINEKLKADDTFLIYQNMYRACYTILSEKADRS